MQFPEMELLNYFPLKGFEIMSLSPTFGQCNHPKMTSIPLTGKGWVMPDFP